MEIPVIPPSIKLFGRKITLIERAAKAAPKESQNKDKGCHLDLEVVEIIPFLKKNAGDGARTRNF